MRIAASAIRTHRRRAGSARWSSAARRRPSRLPTVITQNAGNPVTNTWSYNRRRLPTAETQAPDGARSWTLTYGYNPLGLRTSETAPDNVTTTYTVNALGQTTQGKTRVRVDFPNHPKIMASEWSGPGSSDKEPRAHTLGD